jgi:hypothetical protein
MAEKKSPIAEFAEEMALMEDLARQAIDFADKTSSKTKPQDEKVFLRNCLTILLDIGNPFALHNICKGNIIKQTTWYAEADKHGPIGGVGRWIPRVEVFCDSCKVLYRE